MAFHSATTCFNCGNNTARMFLPQWAVAWWMCQPKGQRSCPQTRYIKWFGTAKVINQFKTCYNISVLFILSLWGKEISYRVFPFNAACVLPVVWVEKLLVKCGGSMMWDFVCKKMFLRVSPTTFEDGTSYTNLGPQTEM
jgi:hypothetical protein